MPEYDEVHIVSDLHIGGAPGFQVFGAASELAALIRHFRERDPKRRLALVINGDMVDFLAEPNARYFEPQQAVAKLDRIFDQEPAFADVWKELQAFVHTASRYLVIVLGNHDLELALPWVRERLLAKLAGSDDAARGRIRLEFDGAGFRCAVGGSSVLCLHGNEVDTWNVTDFEMLRRIGRDYQQGRSVPEWTPNAGTQLVIDVMNDVKKAYAFVDLLKPETPAVVPIILALEEARWPQIRRVLGVASHLSWDTVRRAAGFLSDDEQPNPTALQGLFPVDSRPAEIAAFRPPQANALAQLRHAERLHKNETNPIALTPDGQLGFVDAARAMLRREDRVSVVLAQLQGLEKDRSFHPAHRDATCEQVDRYVSNDVNWVVTGHTHLERILPRAEGGGTYINTGTWIPLIRLTEAMLSSLDEFKKVFAVLESSRTIDALRRMEGLVLHQPAVASIERDGAQVTGRLLRVWQDKDNQIQFSDVR